MLKSLIITYFFPPQIGGVQNYLYHLCKGLNPDKVVVLANKNNGQDINFDQEQDFKIYRTNFFSPKLKLFWFFLFFKAFRIIKKEKIKFLQFGHYHQFCLIGLFAKILFQLPYLIYFHGVDLLIAKKSKIKIFLLKLIVKKAKIVIANSNFIKRELIKLGVKEEKIEVITPGVDFEKFNLSAKDDSIIKKYDLENKKVILSIGRLTRIKGFDLTIKALPNVLSEVGDAIYLIIGEAKNNIDKEYKKELTDLVSQLGLEKKVIFLGEIEDREDIKSKYYNLADLVVMPSREIKYKNYSHIESFGIVSLEAQSMEKPMIASKIGGIGENIINQETGIFFISEDAQDLSLAIIKLLKDKELSLRMGQRGRERMEREFNWQTRVERLKFFLI